MLDSNKSPDFLAASGSSPPVLTTSTLDAAIEWARRGFLVVPLEPRDRAPWQRPTGYTNLPDPTEADIRRWFATEPDLNIGVHMGRGLIALDVDEHDGRMSGSEALRHLEELHGPLPKTLVSITGGGGRHMIFRLPAGYAFGDSLPVIKAGLIATTGDASGGVIDVRGTGYIAIPPSVHPNGNLYRWDDPDVPIATLPLAWCQTPEPLPFTDPERTRKSKSAPRLLAVGDPNTLDRMAHERMANVDPDALLGRDTLLLLANGDPDDEDRSHAMWRAILGAASVRFDSGALYIRMLNSPLEEGLRDHGRAWFDRNWHSAHRYIASQIMAIREIRAEIKKYEWTSVEIEPGRKVSDKTMQIVLQHALDTAERYETLTPILVKCELAKTTGFSRMTVIRAIKALILLGWLAVVPEPTKKYDDPWKYQLSMPIGAVRKQSASSLALQLDGQPQSPPSMGSNEVSFSTPKNPTPPQRQMV